MKTRYYYIFLGLALMFMACQQDPTPPDGTISEEKMAEIQVEIHLLEAKISKLALMNMDSSTILTEHQKQQIFKKYKTDSVAYNRSYQFYATNPTLMERIYDKVVKTLETKQKKKDYKDI